MYILMYNGSKIKQNYELHVHKTSNTAAFRVVSVQLTRTHDQLQAKEKY